MSPGKDYRWCNPVCSGITDNILRIRSDKKNPKNTEAFQWQDEFILIHSLWKRFRSIQKMNILKKA